MVIVIISWLFLGLVVGFIASRIVDLRGDEPLIGIGAAVVGAVIGGLLYKMMATEAYVAWAVGNMLWAAIGAALAVTAFHLIRSRSIVKDRQSVRYSS